MRLIAATGIAVMLAAIAGGAEAREASIYRGPCGQTILPSGATGLESAIRVDTSCGMFSIDEHGIGFAGPRKGRPLIDGLVWLRSRLLFYERGRVVWRSPRWHGERPLGWTRAGLLLYRRGNMLSAQAPSGRAVAHFATAHNSLYRFDPETRTLLFVSPGRELVRTDGRQSETVAALEPLRLGRLLEIVPLQAGRVALVGKRLIVLSPDGSMVASDRRRGSLPALSSQGAIAMISTGPLDDRSRARESVRLLRPGDRSSTLLFANEVGALGCGHWPSLEWRRDDVLYSTSEGDVVVIDPGSGDHLDLTTVVHRLPGDFVQARWA